MISETEKRKLYERDPFAVDPLPRAHYHPSPEKTLTQTEKSINISPARQTQQPDRNGAVPGSDRVSPMDEIFLRGTNSYQRPTFGEDNQELEKLDESWPSTERPSSISLSGIEADSPVDLGRYYAALDRFTDLKKTLSFPDHESPATSPKKPEKPSAKPTMAGKKQNYKIEGSRPSKSQIPVRDGGKPSDKSKAKQSAMKTVNKEEPKDDGSVLQRYIERFRNSAPLSREDRIRQREMASTDFWWLSGGPPTPSDSSTPKDGENGSKKTRRVTPPLSTAPPLTTANLDRFKEKSRQEPGVVSWPPESPGHKKTMELQERADRLLERSSCSSAVSTDPAVSTEGLGSNPSDMSSFEEYTYRPKFAHHLEPDVAPRPHVPLLPPHSFPRPEDDPLHQWRLRRRMEQAQESAPKQTHAFNFLSKTDQQKKIEAKLDEFKQKLAGKDVTAPIPRATHRLPEYQFTPAPQVTDKIQPETTHRDIEPQIASPTLHRRRPQTDPAPDVDPHLHLMCDLLPCPHGAQYKQGISGRGEDSNQVNERLIKGDNLDPKGKGFDSKECDTDAISRYKQFLQAEKPDVDKVNSSDSFDSDKQTEQARDNGDGETSDGPVKFYNTHDVDVPKAKYKTDKTDGVPQRKNTSEIVTESDARKKRATSEDKRSRSQRSKGGRSDSERSRKEERIHRPTHSSSPKVDSHNVDDAIGQVVKDHLFNTTSSLVLSSVESLPPTAPADHQPDSHTPTVLADNRPHSHSQKPTVQEQQSGHDEDECESDGEFGDDGLLEMLRSQRAQYELQLHEIDQTLGRMDRS